MSGAGPPALPGSSKRWLRPKQRMVLPEGPCLRLRTALRQLRELGRRGQAEGAEELNHSGHAPRIQPFHKDTQDKLRKRFQPRIPSSARVPNVLGSHLLSLPAYAKRKAFLSSVSPGNVTFVSGKPGTGKTRLFAQLLLLEYEMNKTPLHALLVLPTREAAESAARSLAGDRGEAVGEGVVALQHGRKRQVGPNACLTVLTTGSLLRLLSFRNLPFTHLLLDEAHVRSTELDLVLGLLRKPRSDLTNVCLVLISATLGPNANALRSYLKAWPSHTVHVKGCSQTLQSYFLQDVVRVCGLAPTSSGSSSSGGSSSGTSSAGSSSSDDSDSDSDEDEAVMDYWDEDKRKPELAAKLALRLVKKGKRSILIVFPGLKELKLVKHHLLLEWRGEPGPLPQLNALIFHGDLPQPNIRSPPAPGCAKLILGSNIATKSITIPSLESVIDSGLDKIFIWDFGRARTYAQDGPVAEDERRQRAGRAGRVRAGESWLLAPKSRKRPSTSAPSITHTNTFDLLLHVCGITSQKCSSFLKDLPSPPVGVDEAVLLGKACGILAYDERPTGLGRFAASVGLAPADASAVLNASLLGALLPVLYVIAARDESILKRALSDDDDVREDVYDDRKDVAEHTWSEAFPFFHALREWKKAQGSAYVQEELEELLHMDKGRMHLAWRRVERMLGALRRVGLLSKVGVVTGPSSHPPPKKKAKKSPEVWTGKALSMSWCNRNSRKVGLVRLCLGAAAFPHVGLLYRGVQSPLNEIRTLASFHGNINDPKEGLISVQKIPFSSDMPSFLSFGLPRRIYQKGKGQCTCLPGLNVFSGAALGVLGGQWRQVDTSRIAILRDKWKKQGQVTRYKVLPKWDLLDLGVVELLFGDMLTASSVVQGRECFVRIASRVVAALGAPQDSEDKPMLQMSPAETGFLDELGAFLEAAEEAAGLKPASAPDGGAIVGLKLFA